MRRQRVQRVNVTIAAIAFFGWGATNLFGCGGVSTGTSDGGGGAAGSAGPERGSRADGSGSSDDGDSKDDGGTSDAVGGSSGDAGAGDDVTSGAAGAAGGGPTDGGTDAADAGNAAGTGGASAGAGGASAGAGGTSAGAGGASAGAGGSSVGGTSGGLVTSCENQLDGTACDDGNGCTAQSTCSAGTCLGATPNETISADHITIACPTTDTAVNGMVVGTCDFPMVLSPNNIYTGPVMLESHNDRVFADFDINPLPDGGIQLVCFYQNADGLGIGSISRIVDASSCTATSDAGFTCSR